VADLHSLASKHVGHAPVQLNFVAACIVIDGETLDLRCFSLTEPPPILVNAQHGDAWADLRTGRANVIR
jgi:hypothetical protein